MSDNTMELLKSFVEANDARKKVALQVLRGEVTTCPYLRQVRAGVGDDGGRVEGPLLLGVMAASRLLGVSRWTLRKLYLEGRISRLEVSPGSYWIRRSDLEALAAAG